MLRRMPALTALVDEVKPRLRGRLHAVVAPLAAIAGLIQVAFAPTPTAKITSAVFCFGSVLLFTVSAIYHTRTCSARARMWLKRWDHANIFVLIACSYTPFAALMLPASAARTLLVVVWTGALLGAAFQVLWVHAPRWLYVPIYLALGWAAVAYFPALYAASPPMMILVAVGGLLYTVGAIVYGLKRPNPLPGRFGFHEIFHACTVLAFLCHWTATLLIALHPVP
jgi:hemolysin III